MSDAQPAEGLSDSASIIRKSTQPRTGPESPENSHAPISDRLLAEFWFQNETECIAALNRLRPSRGQSVSCCLRWHTELGRKLQTHVRAFIEDRQREAGDKASAQFREGKFIAPQFAAIDFANLTIVHGGEKRHINEWLYKISDRSGQQCGWTDLRGVDLSDVTIHTADLTNACFSWAAFSDATLNQMNVSNCNFPKCDFSRAFLGIINCDDHDGFSDADFQSARLNAIALNGVMLGTQPRIREVSYLNALITALAGRPTKMFGGHTEFSSVEIGRSENGEQQKHLSYIHWYPATMLRYVKPRSLVDRSLNVLTAATTKNWRSLSAVFWTSAFAILSFAGAHWSYGEQGFGTTESDGKLSVLDAALKVLTDTGEPMNCKSMVESMLEQKLWKTSGKTPHAMLYSAIIREIQNKGDESRFRKTDRGLFVPA